MCYCLVNDTASKRSALGEIRPTPHRCLTQHPDFVRLVPGAAGRIQDMA